MNWNFWILAIMREWFSNSCHLAIIHLITSCHMIASWICECIRVIRLLCSNYEIETTPKYLGKYVLSKLIQIAYLVVIWAFLIWSIFILKIRVFPKTLDGSLYFSCATYGLGKLYMYLVHITQTHATYIQGKSTKRNNTHTYIHIDIYT